MHLQQVTEITPAIQAGIDTIHGYIKHMYLTPENYLLGGTIDDQLIGYLYSQHSRNSVSSIYVLEEYCQDTQTHVGNILLTQFKNEAINQNITKISSLIQKSNTNAIHFFEHNGFTQYASKESGMIEMSCDLTLQ